MSILLAHFINLPIIKNPLGIIEILLVEVIDYFVPTKWVTKIVVKKYSAFIFSHSKSLVKEMSFIRNPCHYMQELVMLPIHHCIAYYFIKDLSMASYVNLIPRCANRKALIVVKNTIILKIIAARNK